MPLSVRSTFTVILAAAFSAATSASGEDVPLEHRQAAISDGLAQALHEILATAGIDAI